METYQQRSHKFFSRARQKAEDVKNDSVNRIEAQKEKEDILMDKVEDKTKKMITKVSKFNGKVKHKAEKTIEKAEGKAEKLKHKIEE